LLAGLHPDIAVECREGAELSFKYTGHFGLFSVNYNPNLSIKVEKNRLFTVNQYQLNKTKNQRISQL
jgi:hypothetical protein